MIISNDYVKITSDSQNIKLRNTILQYYIDSICSRIYARHGIPSYHMIESIFLKFDNKLEFDSNSVLSYNDFDIFDNERKTNDYVELGSNYSIIRRIFSVEKDVWQYPNGDLFEEISDFSKYYGRKITAIGFGYIYTKNKESHILACVDTSNYNMYFDKNMIFSRQDSITSDQIFTGFNTQQCGHLFLGNFPQLYKLNYNIVKSIGIGHSPSIMDYETEDFEIIKKDNTVTFKEINSVKEVGVFPSEDLYPDDNLFPNTDTARYFIIKYEEYFEKSYYYYVATPINGKIGNLELTITVERG